MASTVLKKALNFKPINKPILARTHRTAKTNNLYSTINPFGPGDPNDIPHPTPMASTILKKALNFTPINTPIFARTYCTAERENLFYRIIYLDDPIPVLEQLVQEGKGPELQHIVQDLYDHEMFEMAAQPFASLMLVFEWVSSKGLPFSVDLNYVLLGLKFTTQGLEAAESYFNNLNDGDKNHMVYNTLLKYYFEEGLVDKCIAYLQKMMELGFLYIAPAYNDLMFLYAYCDQLEKIPIVFLDMKKKGVSPNDFSYRICMHAYGAISDISNMELILKEMENQPPNDMDWGTFAIVANAYVKTGLKEKALIYLKKCASDGILCYSTFRKTMHSIIKLGYLVKFGELKEAEKLFKVWERNLLTPLDVESEVNDGQIKWTD